MIYFVWKKFYPYDFLEVLLKNIEKNEITQKVLQKICYINYVT